MSTNVLPQVCTSSTCKKTWEKLQLAARIIVAIENPEDVCIVSSRSFGTRAAYKFGQYTGSSVVSGRYTPGTFTNQICKDFMEPRILLVTDPRTDSQPVNEASYVNIPVIAFCDTDSPLNCVDVATPCNNKGKNALAVMYWLLTREVLRMRDSINRQEDWDVAIDLFIYKDPEEAEEEAQRNEQLQANRAKEAEAAKQAAAVGANYDDIYAQPDDELAGQQQLQQQDYQFQPQAATPQYEVQQQDFQQQPAAFPQSPAIPQQQVPQQQVAPQQFQQQQYGQPVPQEDWNEPTPR